MRTTTPSSDASASDRTGRPQLVRLALLGLGLCAALLAPGCGTRRSSSEMMQLSPESSARTAMQTRRFDTENSNELLSASAAVLQDLGFQVSESSPAVGFLRGAKERSAREYGQEIARVIIALISSIGIAAGSNTMVMIPVDLHQQINASLVAMPLHGDESRHELRIVFYRLIWRSDGTAGSQYVPPGEMKMEMIHDPVIYQTFFSRLSKAVFLEAHKI